MGNIILIAIGIFIVYKIISKLTNKVYYDNKLSNDSELFEGSVASTLSLRKDVYKVYNNLYFCTPDLQITDGEVSKGSIVQQDIIAITKYGILAIECKDYNGGVAMTIGSQWRHNDGYFSNPVMQNQNHIDILKRISNINIPIFNAVLFSDKLQQMLIVPGEEKAILEAYPYIARFKNLDTLMDSIKNSKEAINLSKNEASKYHKLFIRYMWPDKKIKNAQVLYSMRQKIIHS